jgi:hypothetical protein
MEINIVRVWWEDFLHTRVFIVQWHSDSLHIILLLTVVQGRGSSAIIIWIFPSWYMNRLFIVWLMVGYFMDTDILLWLIRIDLRFIFKSYVTRLELNWCLFGGFTSSIGLSCLQQLLRSLFISLTEVSRWTTFFT